MDLLAMSEKILNENFLSLAKWIIVCRRKVAEPPTTGFADFFTCEACPAGFGVSAFLRLGSFAACGVGGWHGIEKTMRIFLQMA
jgi:hypothetical protein